jgi:hypothetical protein
MSKGSRAPSSQRQLLAWQRSNPFAAWRQALNAQLRAWTSRGMAVVEDTSLRRPAIIHIQFGLNDLKDRTDLRTYFQAYGEQIKRLSDIGFYIQPMSTSEMFERVRQLPWPPHA